MPEYCAVNPDHPTIGMLHPCANQTLPAFFGRSCTDLEFRVLELGDLRNCDLWFRRDKIKLRSCATRWFSTGAKP